MLILCQINDSSQTLCIHIFIEERVFHTLRHEIKKNLLQLSRIDRPSVRRKSDLHAQHDVSALRINAARRALQHFLRAAAHRDQSALSRALCLKCELLRPSAELPRQLILQSNPLMVSSIKFLRESRGAPGHAYAHL